MLDKIFEIHERFKKQYPCFPKDMCSTSVKALFDKLGFSPKCGFVFWPDTPFYHSWGVKDGMLADITLYQFSSKKILEIPIIIYMPEKDAITQYRYFEIPEITELMQRAFSSRRKRVTLQNYLSL